MDPLLTVPNLLTLARLGLTPLIVWLILIPAPGWALLLLFAAGLTDALDGYLARRCGWTSRAGASLDPIADKVLMAGAYLSLGHARLLPWWLITLVFGRDVLILLGAAMLAARGTRREFRPSLWGKLSTFLQISTAVAALSAAAFPSLPLAAPLRALIVLTAAGTVWSGTHYFYTAVLRSNGAG